MLSAGWLLSTVAEEAGQSGGLFVVGITSHFVRPWRHFKPEAPAGTAAVSRLPHRLRAHFRSGLESYDSVVMLPHGGGGVGRGGG